MIKKQVDLYDDDLLKQSTTTEEGLAKLIDGMIDIKDIHLLTELPTPQHVSLITAIMTVGLLEDVPEYIDIAKNFMKGMVSFKRKSRSEMTELAKGVKEESSSTSLLGKVRGFLGR